MGTGSATILLSAPIFTRRWPLFRSRTKLVHSCVEPVPLCHVYSHQPPAYYVAAASSALGKTWPAAAPGLLGQASYSAGRLAEFWHRLSIGDPGRFQRIFGPGAECCFWAEGVHRFRPVFGFPGHLAVAKVCFRPNPTELPRVLPVGEARSSHQGWTEGALETSEWALQWILDAVTTTTAATAEFQKPVLPISAHHLEGGKCLDVALWESRHPGGNIPTGALSDLMSRMEAVGHSDAAFACAFYLSILPLQSAPPPSAEEIKDS